MEKESKTMICPYCGGQMVWGSTCNANEISDEYDEEDTAVVDYYLCDTCGRDFEVIEPNEELRKKDYSKYWNEK